MGEVGLYGLYVCNLPAHMQTGKLGLLTDLEKLVHFLQWVRLFRVLTNLTIGMKFSSPRNENVWKYVWMNWSRKWSQFNKTIIHSRKHDRKPRQLGFCKFGHLWMTIPQNQSHASSPLDGILEKEDKSRTFKIQICLYFFSKEEL